MRRRKPLRRGNTQTRGDAPVTAAIAVGPGVRFAGAQSFAGPPFARTTGESYAHIRPCLGIRIEGRNVTIPEGVGTVEGGRCLEPVRTHGSSETLHIELTRSDARGHNHTLGGFTVRNHTVRSGAGTAPALGGATLPVAFSSTDEPGHRANSTYRAVLLVDSRPNPGRGSLNLEHPDHCSASSRGSPRYPTPCSDPPWKGSANDPYGTGHGHRLSGGSMA